MKNFLISNDSFLKALLFAQKIAKQTGGKIATMSDLAKMRTKSNFDSLTWHSWVAPLSMLFFGVYRGKRIIVVAHHLGPLITDERLKEWEKSGEKDKGNNREKYGAAGCPKITQDEFDKLVEGTYGDVIVLEFDHYFTNFKEHLYGGHLSIDMIVTDPLLKALLSDNAEEYQKFLDRCLDVSEKNAKEKNKEAGSGKKILELGIKDRYGCGLFNPHSKEINFPKTPIALMLTLGRPSFWGNHDLSVSTEVRTHERLDYSQFVVLNDLDEELIKLKVNIEMNWQKCLVPNEKEFDTSFFSLCGGSKLFAEYPKKIDGAYIDTGKHMFPLIGLDTIGEPTYFQTDDCDFFLRYHINEVKKISPKGANAYAIIGDVQGRGNVTVPIQFYYAKPMTDKRIMTPEEVMDNLELLLEINNVLLPA
jgi:hypothetical protein